MHYYIKKKPNKWKKVTFFDIPIKLIYGEIDENTKVWHPNFCPYSVIYADICTHSIPLRQCSEMPLKIFSTSEVTDEEIGYLKSYGKFKIPRDINEEIQSLADERGQEFVDAIRENSLNKNETILISSYADLTYKYLNGELRKVTPDKNEAYLFYELLLNKALKKVKPENNSTVYRMVDTCGDEEIYFSWFQARVNETVQFPSFLSSSKDKWPNYELYFEITTNENSAGKYIAWLTNKPKQEQEVLFMSNSCFLIANVDKSKNTVYLTECPYGTKGDTILVNCYEMSDIDNENEEDDQDDWMPDI